MNMKRLKAVDILRGLAIVLMVVANTTPDVLIGAVPQWFKIICSLPAPLFVFIAGMMVALGASKGKTLLDFIKRGLFVFSMGILVDVGIWHIVPFAAFDILYLIGLSLPLVYLAQKSTRVGVVLGTFIFAISPFLRHFGVYIFDLPDIPLKLNSTVFSAYSGSLWHMLVDGWFPLFPWVGFSIFGAIRFKLKDWNLLKYLDVLLFSIGVLLYIKNPITIPSRGGYEELFYPAVTSFSLVALGVIGLLFTFVQYVDLKIYKFFELFGRNSMFVYLLHLAIINWVISVIWPNTHLNKFLLIQIPFILVLYGILKLKEFTKSRIANG